MVRTLVGQVVLLLAATLAFAQQGVGPYFPVPAVGGMKVSIALGPQFSTDTSSCAGAGLSAPTCFNDFVAFVLPQPQFYAATVVMKWGCIERSQGVYTFTDYDNQIATITGLGKKVIILVQAVNFNTNGGTAPCAVGVSQPFTPSYIFSTPPGVDVCQCAAYPGDSSMIGSCNNSVGGNTTGFPAVYESPFLTPYITFIKALLAHYAGNSNIFYIRVGLAPGAEVQPNCGSILPGFVLSGGFPPNLNNSAWLAALNSLYGAAAANSGGLTIEMPFSVYNDAPNDQTWPVGEAQIGAGFGLGIGIQAIRKGDIQNCGQSSGQWCYLFNALRAPVKEIQMIAATDWTGIQFQGSMVSLAPVLIKNGVTSWELLGPDGFACFDPNAANYIPASTQCPQILWMAAGKSGQQTWKGQITKQ